MKVIIDNDVCSGCGLCADNCPAVFEMGEDIAKVKVDTVPADSEADARQAADDCPVEAIAIQ